MRPAPYKSFLPGNVLMNLEALELLAHGYLRCHYVSLYCPACGMIRWATAWAPEGEYCDCPNCARPHCNFGVVGEGFTNKELPRHEIWWTAPRLWAADHKNNAPRARHLRNTKHL